MARGKSHIVDPGRRARSLHQSREYCTAYKKVPKDDSVCFKKLKVKYDPADYCYKISSFPGSGKAYKYTFEGKNFNLPQIKREDVAPEVISIGH